MLVYEFLFLKLILFIYVFSLIFLAFSSVYFFLLSCYDSAFPVWDSVFSSFFFLCKDLIVLRPCESCYWVTFF